MIEGDGRSNIEMPNSEEWLRKEEQTIAKADFATRPSNDLPMVLIQAPSSAEKLHPIITVNTALEDAFPSPVLPPKDKGRAAIARLIACILLDSTTYGVLLCYGVFQEYYTSHFADHSKASWIGVLSNALVFGGAPLVTFCCQRYDLPRKYYICVGWAICVLSLLVSAFINNLPGLIVVQGLCYGIGALLVSIPQLIVLNTWFEQRRGFAYGILFGFSDLVGAGYTFLATALLRRVGLRGALLVNAGIIFCFAGPAIYFLDERPVEVETPIADTYHLSANHEIDRRRSSGTSSIAPVTRRTTMRGDLPFSPSPQAGGTWPIVQPKKRYFNRAIFYIYTMSNIAQAFAAYLPFIYLPIFATQMGHSRQTGAIILAVGNIGMLFGDLGFGHLSDKLHVNILILVSSGVSALVTFLMWGFSGAGASSEAILISYAFIFGIFAGGFIVLWPRMGTLFGERDAHMVYSMMCFGRGVGGVASGPVSQALLTAGTPYALRAFKAGPYGLMIVFVGICMTVSALLAVLAMLALWYKKEQNAQILQGKRAPKNRSWTW